MPNYPYSFTLPPVNKQDIPSNGVPGEFLGISAGGVLDWLPVSGGSGTGDLLAANNLSELTPTAGTARTNLGLGTGDSPTFANLTLTSPSLASSAPVTISQTWNNAAVNFNELFVRATDTASGASSNLLYVERITSVGAVKALLSLNKLGVLNLLAATESGGIDLGGYGFLNAFNWQMRNSNGYIGLGATATEADTRLYRDTNNTLALRNGANTQTFNVYGSYGSISDYKRLSISCDQTTGNATITNQAAGYTAGTVSINGVPVGLGKGNFSGNVAIGTGALNANTTGTDNVAVGFEALALGTGNFETVAIGWKASRGSGARNTSIGYGANNLGANDSVSIGWASMYNLTGGSLNVAIGRAAGYFITGGSTSLTSCTKSLFLGCDTKALGQSQENQIVIGYDATGIGSNSVVLGNDSITKTALKGNVGIGTTAPTAPLEIRGAAVTNTRENLLKCTMNDAGNDAFHIYNGTGFDTRFSPAFSGSVFSGSGAAPALNFVGQTTSANDTGTVPLSIFQGRITSSETDPNNGTFSNVATRPLFGWWNVTTPLMQLNANGNLGIGTTSPTSKLHVAGTIKPEQATMVDTALTTYTLASTDAGTIINCTAATAVTVNLPTLDTNAGYNVMIIQSGAGAVTIAANGNTRNSFGSAFTTAGQHAACSIVRTAASTYNLSGNLV